MKLHSLYSTVSDGNMSIKYGDADSVINNRNRFFHKQGINPRDTLWINVNYSDDIFVLDDVFYKDHQDLSKTEIHTDCVLTKIPNIFIYLGFGDCIPFCIYDPRHNIMGFAHLGWQSVELELHKKIIDKLSSEFGSNVKDLCATLGPSIKKESYILDKPSQLRYEKWQPYLSHVGDDRYGIDLNGFIVNQLRGCGIEKIENSPYNTAESDQFFSHYGSTYLDKSRTEGRFIFGSMMR